MKVREVMEITGLTRKALYYYEEIGIVRPAHDPLNKYREYTTEEVRALSKVANLVQLGVDVQSIVTALKTNAPIDSYLNDEKAVAILSERLSSIERQANELERQKTLIQSCLNGGLDGISERLVVASKASAMDEREREEYMSNQLITAFPGDFGRAMSDIFSPFLNEPLDTPDKVRAWHSLLAALDDFDPVVLPDTFHALSEGIRQGVALDETLKDFAADDPLDDGDVQLAVWSAEYLVHHAGAFLEPFFEFLDVLSSRFRRVRRVLLRIARSIEGETDG